MRSRINVDRDGILIIRAGPVVLSLYARGRKEMSASVVTSTRAAPGVSAQDHQARGKQRFMAYDPCPVPSQGRRAREQGVSP